MSNIEQDASLHKENLVPSQLYQKALELGKQLNAILSQDSANHATFKPECLTLRNKIQQLCIKLMFLNPVEYGEKAEELLWMNVYYNVIRLRFKDGLHHANISEADFERLLDNGVMFYQNLFFFLQEHYELGPANNRTQRNVIDCRRVVPATEKEVDWARLACYHCLLYLGDLFYFKRHIKSVGLKKLAAIHYLAALSMSPHMGMSYNRLASLLSDDYYNVDKAFFYQCSMHSVVPARDASFRLRNLYANAVEMYNHMMKCQLGMPSSGQEKCEPNKRLLVKVLYLQNFLHPDSCMDPRLALLSQSVLEDFRLCLFSKLKGEHIKGFFLSDHIIFHMVTLCIMSVDSLKKTVGVYQSRAAVTFILVLFSHLVHHVTMRIQSELDGMGGSESQKINDVQWVQWKDSDLGAYNFAFHHSKPFDSPEYSHPSEEYSHYISAELEGDSDQSKNYHSNGDSDSENSLDKNDNGEDLIFSLNSDLNNKKSSLSVEDKGVNCPLFLDKQLELRGRSTSQSPIIGTLGAVSSSSIEVLDTSETMSTSLSTLHTPNSQTEQRTLKKPHPEFKSVNGKKCPECDTFSTKRRLCRQAHARQNLKKKLSIFASQELLYTIKIFLNWLWIDPDLTLECTHSSPRLLSHLTALLKLLPTIQELEGAHLDLATHLWDLILISEESDVPISLLLPEDVSICNLLPMKEAHQRICFIRVPPLLNPIEKGILYTCFLRSFGHFFAKIPDSLMRSYSSKASYRSITSVNGYLKRQGTPSSSSAEEVAQQLLHPLLSSVHAHRWMPLYLIPDTQALCQYLPIIQELITDDRYIVIISNVVIDELIVLKHKEPGAYATINFLTDKLKEKRYWHSRFQKNAGKDVRSRMNRENPDSRDLSQILEECKDLVRGTKAEADDRSRRMIILTGFSVDSTETFSHPLQSDFQTSAIISIEIKHTLQFYREWKMIR